MKKNTFGKWSLCAGTGLLLMLAGGVSYAGWQDDLEGRGLDHGQRKMGEHGFRIVHSDAEHGKQYWWKEENSNCLLVKTHGHKIDKVKAVDNQECREYLPDPHKAGHGHSGEHGHGGEHKK